MEFGKRRDSTDTTDFCPCQLVTELLQGNWCNGFWPLLVIHDVCSQNTIRSFARLFRRLLLD